MLAARGLQAELRDGGLWAWDEEAIPAVRDELERFRRRPADPRWQAALRTALRRSEARRAGARAELRARSRRAWRRERRLRRAFAAAPSSRPLTLGLLALGALLLWLGRHEAAAALPVLASCYWLHELGTQVEPLRGTRHFGLLLLALSAAPALAAALAGLSSGGLAGPAFGLLGYTCAVAALDGGSGLRLPPGLLPLMAGWLALCALGAAPVEVLLAQCCGLTAGLLAGVATVRRHRLA